MPEVDPKRAIGRLVELATGLAEGYVGCCDPASDDAVREAQSLYSSLGALPPERLAGLGVTGDDLGRAETAYQTIAGSHKPLPRHDQREHAPMSATDAIRMLFDEADMVGAHYAAGGHYMPDHGVVESIRSALNGMDASDIIQLLPEGGKMGAFLGAYKLVTGDDL